MPPRLETHPSCASKEDGVAKSERSEPMSEAMDSGSAINGPPSFHLCTYTKSPCRYQVRSGHLSPTDRATCPPCWAHPVFAQVRGSRSHHRWGELEHGSRGRTTTEGRGDVRPRGPRGRGWGQRERWCEGLFWLSVPQAW